MTDCCEGHRIECFLIAKDMKGAVLGQMELQAGALEDVLAALEEGECLYCSGLIK